MVGVSAFRIFVAVGIAAGVLWAFWVVWWMILVLLRLGDIRRNLDDLLEVLSVAQEDEASPG